MTYKQIALVCAVAGLNLAAANVLIDALATRIYNCNPDPYYPEMCTAQAIAYLGVIVGCWLVATYLLARHEAIEPFACLVIGPMLWFGIVAWAVLSTFVIESPYDNLSGFWGVALVGTIISWPVPALLTTVVGYPMQLFIQARRRKRLGRPAAERPARGPGRIVTKGRWLGVVSALILVLATAGVLLYSRGVRHPVGNGGSMVMVIVSKVDIPARTDLDQMIKADQFRAILVPESVVVNGAITSIDQLSHRRTRVAILAGEQILVARIKAYERDGSGCCGP
jgi:hypothetical protein